MKEDMYKHTSLGDKSKKDYSKPTPENEIRSLLRLIDELSKRLQKVEFELETCKQHLRQTNYNIQRVESVANSINKGDSGAENNWNI